jgi:hypothetical protein
VLPLKKSLCWPNFSPELQWNPMAGMRCDKYSLWRRWPEMVGSSQKCNWMALSCTQLFKNWQLQHKIYYLKKCWNLQVLLFSKKSLWRKLKIFLECLIFEMKSWNLINYLTDMCWSWPLRTTVFKWGPARPSYFK